VLYLLALTIGQIPVSAYIIFSSTVLYPTYAAAPRLLPLTPLEDQQLGGILMNIVGTGVLFGVLAGVFWQWGGADGRSCTGQGSVPKVGGAEPQERREKALRLGDLWLPAHRPPRPPSKPRQNFRGISAEIK
jgi:hypothetical protein